LQQGTARRVEGGPQVLLQGGDGGGRGRAGLERPQPSSARGRNCPPRSPAAVALAAAAGGAIGCARRFPFLVEVLATPHARKGASLRQAFTPGSASVAIRTLRFLRKSLMPGRLHPMDRGKAHLLKREFDRAIADCRKAIET